MRYHCHCPMKEVQDTVVNALQADPKFVNSIAQKVGLRPPQFVAHFTQPLDSQKTLVLDSCRQSAKPGQERARSVFLPVKRRLSFWALDFQSIRKLAKLQRVI